MAANSKNATKISRDKNTVTKTLPPTESRLALLKGGAKQGSLIYRSFDHTRQVARYAMMLFDQLKGLHTLDGKWRTRIVWAAHLHDVGLAEGEKGHHKTSQKKILQDKTLPLSATDRIFVATLARFHRKAMPTVKHRELMSLPRDERQKTLIAIALLRFADGLDRRWKHDVKSFEISIKDSTLLFDVKGEGKVGKAFANAKKKAGKLLGYQLALQTMPKKQNVEAKTTSQKTRQTKPCASTRKSVAKRVSASR